MKIRHLIDYLEKNFDLDDDIAFSDLYGSAYFPFELKGEKVCGTSKVKDHACGYWCCRKPDHEGDCYTSVKNVYYREEEDEY